MRCLFLLRVDLVSRCSCGILLRGTCDIMNQLTPYQEHRMPSSGPAYSVPIFPLDMVVFPHMPVALHIFEERYRAMVRDIESKGNRFCIALINEGPELDGEADPHMVGSVVEVVYLEPLSDGRYNLVAVGVERVYIGSIDNRRKPYLMSDVLPWPEADNDPPAPLAEKASGLFKRYTDSVMQLTSEQVGDFTLPLEPALLSYVLATGLQVDTGERQRLLEIPGTTERLLAEIELMESEIPLLQMLAKGPKPPPRVGNFSLN